MRDEDRVRPRRERDRIVIGQIEQQREHADVHVREVAHTLAQHRCRMPREAVAPLQHDDVERLLGAEVLPDELLDVGGQVLVVEDGELDVEDRRLFGAGGRLDAGAQLMEALARAGERGVEVLDLGANPFVGHDAMPDVGHLPAQEVHVTDHDARRGGNAPDLSLH